MEGTFRGKTLDEALSRACAELRARLGELHYDTISDGGVGMDQHTLEHIFDPFFTTKEAGSGIGLSLSRQILKLHGGYIHLVSSSKSGTTFELGFPIYKGLQ